MDLKGSEKQIAWAEKIREEKLDGILAISPLNSELTAINESITTLKSIDSAKFWINHRSYPPFVFVAYAYKKLNIKMPVYYQRQTIKNNDHESTKIVPVKIAFIGQFGIKPSTLVKGLFNFELHQKSVDNQLEYSLFQSKEEARTCFIKGDENSSGTLVRPIAELLEHGWASTDIELVVLVLYPSKDRIGGENKAYAFEQIK